MSQYTTLLQHLEQIRDERGMHANTATRVGTALIELLSYCDASEALAGKVDKVAGWGLSQNDLTDVLLASLQDKYTQSYIDEHFLTKTQAAATYLTKDDAAETYLTREYFHRLFRAQTAEGRDIDPNDTETAVDSIKAMVGLWTNQYLSSLGLNASGSGSGGGGGGATALADLTVDTLITAPSAGQVLKFTDGKWKNRVLTRSDISDFAHTHDDRYYTETEADNKFVAKVSGKGLSEKDFTTDLYNKLMGIDDGANAYVHPTGGANTTISAANGKVLSEITVNSLGHVTSVSSKTLAAADIPTLTKSKISDFPTTWAWSAITGTPTTLAGYGITDAATSAQMTAATGRILTLEGYFNTGGVAKVAAKLGTATVGGTAKPIYLNAGVATALSATVGSATKGVYLSSGTVTAMTYSLSATVNAGAANRIAYYSGANAIDDYANILVLPNTLNSANAYMNGLRICGQQYGNSASYLLSGEAGVLQYGDGGPQIIFSSMTADSSSAQSATMLFTCHDTPSRTLWGCGYSFHFLGDPNDQDSTHDVAVVSDSFVAKKRIYLHSGVYLEYDATNGGVHLVGAGVYADNYVSALGLSANGTPVSVSALDWSQLNAVDNDANHKIDNSHLNFDINDYALKTWVQSQGYLTSYTEQYRGTVTQVKVGTTAYNPVSGVVSLPAYPTTLPASDVSAWAKAAAKPTYTLDEVGDGSTRKLANYLPLTGGTLTNALTIKGPNHQNLIVNSAAETSGVKWTGIQFNHTTGTTNTFYGGIRFDTQDGDLKRYDSSYNIYKVWDSGNDGSGSGLDADLLDGTHKADLFSSLANSNDELSLTIGGTNKTLTVAYATKASKLGTSTVGGTAKPIYLNAGTATALSATVGSATKGAYLSQGTITAMTYSLSADVNAGAVNRMAYYSGANAIDDAVNILAIPNTKNSVDAYMNGLRICGQQYGNTASDLLSGAAGVLQYGDGGPQIIFSSQTSDSSSAQSATMLFTCHDVPSWNCGYSFHFLGDPNDGDTKHTVAVVADSLVAKSRLYLASGVYMENDSANAGVHIVGAGIYSNSYVSALGISAQGSSGGALSLLTDVNIGTPTDGQVLTYNALTAKWTAETVAQSTNADTLDGYHASAFVMKSGFFYNSKSSGSFTPNGIELPLSSAGGGVYRLDLSDYAQASALAGYLPLTAGSDYPVTGTLTLNNQNHQPLVINTSATSGGNWVGISIGHLDAQGNRTFFGGIRMDEQNGELKRYNSAYATYTIWDSGNFTPGDYLPLSAGSGKPLTGSLYMDNDRYIYLKDAGGTARNVFGINTSGTVGDFLIGYGVSPAGCNTHLYGNNIYFRNGSSRGWAMAILSEGTVGIGTGSPSTAYKLDVNGTTCLRDSLTIYNNKNLYFRDTNGTAREMFVLNGNNDLLLGFGTGNVSSGGATYIYGKNIYLKYGGTNFTGLSINSFGNVGIGVDNPEEKLQISGGRLRIGDGYIEWDSTNQMMKFSGGKGIYTMGAVAALGIAGDIDGQVTRPMTFTEAVTINSNLLIGQYTQNGVTQSRKIYFGDTGISIYGDAEDCLHLTGNDIVLDAAAGGGDTVFVKNKLDITQDLSVGRDASIGRDLSVGRNVVVENEIHINFEGQYAGKLYTSQDGSLYWRKNGATTGTRIA